MIQSSARLPYRVSSSYSPCPPRDMLCTGRAPALLRLTPVERAEAAGGCGPRLGAPPEVRQGRHRSHEIIKWQNVTELNATLTAQREGWREREREREMVEWLKLSAPWSSDGGVELSHGVMHILLGNSLYGGRLRGPFRRRRATLSHDSDLGLPAREVAESSNALKWAKNTIY